MASKLERWKRIASNNSESIPNPNKVKIVEDLSRVPVVESEDKEELKANQQDPAEHDKQTGQEPQEELEESKDSKPNNPNESVSTVIQSNDSTHEVGLQSRSTTSTPSSKGSRSRSSKQEEKFISRVNNAVRSYIDNKVTKEDTHKKTSFLIKLENLAKLENFDKAHGGRIKGEFINNLLENAFSELEEDPEWKKILNRDLDLIINNLKSRR
jgi:hypothetical protein